MAYDVSTRMLAPAEPAPPLPGPPWWMVRAGARGLHATWFEQDHIVAIGWYDIDWTQFTDHGAILEKLRNVVPAASRRQRTAVASQIERFLRIMQTGHRVISYDGHRRIYLLGTITGGSVYRPDAPHRLMLQRPVTWSGIARRDSLPQHATMSLGAMSRLFVVHPLVAAELQRCSSRLPGGEQSP